MHPDQPNGLYAFSDDKRLLVVGVIHAYLTQSYWAAGIPRSIVERAIDGSLCFGIYCQSRQVGFARAITDRATFAYLADVFVLESHRGRGLSKQLMSFIQTHPELKDLRRFMLITKDAHGLYKQFGFTEAINPDRTMEIRKPDAYAGLATGERPDQSFKGSPGHDAA